MKSKKRFANDGIEILIVEDSPTQSEKLKFILEQNGYRVTAAVDGVEALDFIHRNKPNMVISDIMMPKMDGFTFCDHIKKDERFKDIPVILLTALSDPKDVIRGLECGADNFIVKPYEEDYLLSRIEYIFANWQMHKNEKVRMGVEIFFSGKKYYITSDRLQVLNLLLTTYETAVNKNLELIKTRDELTTLNENLESLVQKRTFALTNEIEERNRIEEALRESETKYRTLIETSPDSIVLTDLEGKIIFCNVRTCELYGSDNPDDLIGTNAFGLVAPEDRARAIVNAQRTIDEGRVKNEEYHLIRKDGSHLYAEISASLIRDDTGKSSAFIGVIRDITERRKAGEAIRKLISAVEQTDEIIFMTDPDGIINYVNPAFEKVYGFTKDEAVGKTPRILKSGVYDVAVYKEFWDTIASGKGVLRELINKTKNGAQLIIEAAINPVLNENGDLTGFIAVQRDITEKKRVEQELIAAKERAEQSDKLKDAFIANMSHEIRTPLNIISGYTMVIQEMMDDRIKDAEREYFESIHRGSERLIRTVDAILNISRLEVGDISFTPVPFDLALLLEKMVHDFQPTAERKSLKLTFKNILDHFNMVGDEYCITQAFSNLIDNAIKYTHHGFVEVRLYSINDDKVCVAVEDTGIGISEDYLPHLFEPYSQEEVGYTRAYEGIGLGMALVKKYLALHNANITVQSKKGEGTTFTIHFSPELPTPAKIVFPGTKLREDKPPRLHWKAAAQKPTVIVVDDDIPTLEYMKLILKDEYQTETASTGSQMWTILKSKPVDIILMDITLRDEKSGLELTREIRSAPEYSNIGIIAVTAHAFHQDREKALQAGCDDYRSKPFRKILLLESMERLLDSKKKVNNQNMDKMLEGKRVIQ